jgi:hypothetical protein
MRHMLRSVPRTSQSGRLCVTAEALRLSWILNSPDDARSLAPCEIAFVPINVKATVVRRVGMRRGALHLTRKAHDVATCFAFHCE